MSGTDMLRKRVHRPSELSQGLDLLVRIRLTNSSHARRQVCKSSWHRYHNTVALLFDRCYDLSVVHGSLHGVTVRRSLWHNPEHLRGPNDVYNSIRPAALYDNPACIVRAGSEVPCMRV